MIGQCYPPCAFFVSARWIKNNNCQGGKDFMAFVCYDEENTLQVKVQWHHLLVERKLQLKILTTIYCLMIKKQPIMLRTLYHYCIYVCYNAVAG